MFVLLWVAATLSAMACLDSAQWQRTPMISQTLRQGRTGCLTIGWVGCPSGESLLPLESECFGSTIFQRQCSPQAYT